MKTRYLLVPIVAAALPFATALAEDTAKPAASDQTKEESSQGMGMMDEKKGMMMGKMMSMMSNLKDQDAELDKLVAEMNSAPSEKKADAIVAVVNKLVEQRKARHEQMQKMMQMMMGMKMDGD